jgi:hypothetical protein
MEDYVTQTTPTTSKTYSSGKKSTSQKQLSASSSASSRTAKSSSNSIITIIFREDDSQWPAPDKIGRQELEIKLGNTHISFTVIKYLLNIRLQNLAQSKTSPIAKIQMASESSSTSYKI